MRGRYGEAPPSHAVPCRRSGRPAWPSCLCGAEHLCELVSRWRPTFWRQSIGLLTVCLQFWRTVRANNGTPQRAENCARIEQAQAWRARYLPDCRPRSTGFSEKMGTRKNELEFNENLSDASDACAKRQGDWRAAGWGDRFPVRPGQWTHRDSDAWHAHWLGRRWGRRSLHGLPSSRWQLTHPTMTVWRAPCSKS